MFIAKARSNLLQNSKILDWLDACVDHLTESSNLESLDWIGWDRILFATDYPHWDFDDPRHAFPCRLSEAEKRAIFRGNAESIYKL